MTKYGGERLTKNRERNDQKEWQRTSPLIMSSSASSSWRQRTMGGEAVIDEIGKVDAKHDDLWMMFMICDRVWWSALSFKKQGFRRWKKKLWQLRWMKRWLKAMKGYGFLERGLLTEMITFSYVFRLMKDSYVFSVENGHVLYVDLWC